MVKLFCFYTETRQGQLVEINAFLILFSLKVTGMPKKIKTSATRLAREKNSKNHTIRQNIYFFGVFVLHIMRSL